MADQVLRTLIRSMNDNVQARTLAEKLAYAVSLQALRRGFRRVPFTDQNGNRFELEPHHVIDRSIILNGQWEPHVTQGIKDHLRPGMVFYDVGANIGYDSLLAARRVGPGGRVLAFEPNPEIARRLRAHVALNGQSQVEVIEACVVPSDDTRAVLYVPPSDRIQNPGRATVVPDAGFHPVGCRAVRIDTLLRAGSVPPPDAVKIDVEGFELDVLRSMASVVESERPLVVFLEVTFVGSKGDGSIEYLSEHGFGVERMSAPYCFNRDGERYQQHDAVLVRR